MHGTFASHHVAYCHDQILPSSSTRYSPSASCCMHTRQRSSSDSKSSCVAGSCGPESSGKRCGDCVALRLLWSSNSHRQQHIDIVPLGVAGAHRFSSAGCFSGGAGDEHGRVQLQRERDASAGRRLCDGSSAERGSPSRTGAASVHQR